MAEDNKEKTRTEPQSWIQNAEAATAAAVRQARESAGSPTPPAVPPKAPPKAPPIDLSPTPAEAPVPATPARTDKGVLMAD